MEGREKDKKTKEEAMITAEWKTTRERELLKVETEIETMHVYAGVCMYVSVYVCKCVCMCMCVYVSVCARAHASVLSDVCECVEREKDGPLFWRSTNKYITR